MWRRIFIGALLIPSLAIAAAIGLAWWAHDAFEREGPSTADQVLVIPKGSGLARIAGLLEQAEVIGDARLFRLSVRYHQQANALLRIGNHRRRANNADVDGSEQRLVITLQTIWAVQGDSRLGVNMLMLTAKQY